MNTKPVVRNLGSWFHSQLSMSEPNHISKLCSSAFFHLHNISRIRKFLPVETKSLVHAFVTYRVDYCNSLLYGLLASQLNKVHRVLNTAARQGILLASSTFRTKVTLGDSFFQVAAPKLWNALPRGLRDIPNLHTFKRNIKTFLFKFAYG